MLFSAVPYICCLNCSAQPDDAVGITQGQGASWAALCQSSHQADGRSDVKFTLNPNLASSAHLDKTSAAPPSCHPCPGTCHLPCAHTIRSTNCANKTAQSCEVLSIKMFKTLGKRAVRRKLHVASPDKKLHMLQSILLLCCGAVGQQQLSPSGDLAVAVDASQETLPRKRCSPSSCISFSTSLSPGNKSWRGILHASTPLLPSIPLLLWYLAAGDSTRQPWWQGQRSRELNSMPSAPYTVTHETWNAHFT